MEQLIFYDYEEFAEFIADVFYEDEEQELTIVANGFDAKNIITEIVRYGFDVGNISCYDYDGYSQEYYIYVNSDGVACCEAYDVINDIYFDDYCNTAFILDNCSSKIVSHIKEGTTFEVSINSDTYCNGDCEHCEHCEHNDIVYDHATDDNIKGFSMSGDSEFGHWSKSFYSSDPELVSIMLDKWSK